MAAGRLSFRWKRLVKGLGVALAVLAFLEGGIRATGFVSEDVLPSPVGFQALPRQLQSDGTTPESMIYQAWWQREVLRKTPGFRVLLVGGSAVQGQPLSPYAGFAGRLQVELNKALDTPVEVINLGSKGIALRHVRAMVQMVLKEDQPDLIVVVSGNNEYHEIRVLKSLLPDFKSRIWLLRRSLFSLHLYRLLHRFLPERNQFAEILDSLEQRPRIGKLTITIDAVDRALVETLYQRDLEGIVAEANAAGVPVLLSTVVTNLQFCTEFPEPGEKSPAFLRVLEKMELAADQHDTVLLREKLDQLKAMEPSSWALCQAGGLLTNAGLFTEAYEILEQAEYHSPRPFRSNLAQRQIVRDVALEAEVGMCDLAARISALSFGGIPGYEVFADNCHPNPLGHFRIGAVLAQCVLEQGLLGPAVAPMSLEEEARLRVAVPEENPYRLDRWLGQQNPLATVPAPPKDEQPKSLAEAGHQAFMFHEYEQALAYYARSIEAGGPEPELRLSRALTLLHLPDLALARTEMDRALDGLGPDPFVADLRATLGP